MKDEGTAQPLFRANADDLRRIDADVAEISEIQRQLRDRHPDLKCLDRVAHQYQIAGGKVLLRVATELPEGFSGIGLFVPGIEHIGVGRLSPVSVRPTSNPIRIFLACVRRFWPHLDSAWIFSRSTIPRRLATITAT